MVAPLKLNLTLGDQKEMSTTEEQYLAHWAGKQLADAATTDVSALSSVFIGGGTTVGAYTNSYYNQAVGTHPGTSLSVGSAATTIYQHNGTASETGITRPLKFTQAGSRVDEMNDTDFNEVVERLKVLIFTNDYAGVYKLNSTAPSADYDVHYTNIFADTRADGTTVNYSIYQRQTYTAPTAVKPMKLDGAAGNIKEMSDAEIKLTFGQRLKNRIAAVVGGVGRYQLRSSSQGTPTDPGSWRNMGSATDTRNTTTEVAYSATYSANYTTTFSAGYTTIFTGDYIGNYINPNGTAFTRNRTVGPSFVWNPTSYFTGDYIGNYLGPGPTYTLNSTVNYTGTFTGDYVGDFTGDYIGDYTGTTLSAGTGTIDTYTLYVRAS
jgi:hypothetical protein